MIAEDRGTLTSIRSTFNSGDEPLAAGIELNRRGLPSERSVKEKAMPRPGAGVAEKYGYSICTAPRNTHATAGVRGVACRGSRHTNKVLMKGTCRKVNISVPMVVGRSPTMLRNRHAVTLSSQRFIA